MAKTTARPALVLSPEEQQQLQSLAASRTASLREVQRARILLGYHAGENFSVLSRTLRLSRRIIYKHVDRALAAGVAVALRDHPHGSAPTITPEAKAWVLSVACTKPKDHGLAAELWTRSALAKHIGRTAQAAKSTVHVILRDAAIRPHKIKYYLERRDPEFDRKMKEVLIVYREVSQLVESPPPPGTPRTVTVSVDEKPGVQALATTSPDLPPVPGEHPEVGRDYEYKRLGTASILAGLDLHDGHGTARVERRHAERRRHRRPLPDNRPGQVRGDPARAAGAPDADGAADSRRAGGKGGQGARRPHPALVNPRARLRRP